jgi:type II secretory ATPase GspE/PulE/Tfp pilus assembly ATPase PilB-like protein
MDMGMEGFNVASAINLIVAQRLVPRICTSCATKYVPDEAELGMAKVHAKMTLRELEFSDVALAEAKPRATKHALAFARNVTLDTQIGQLAFFKGAGCDACQGTGYKGRQGLYETMNMTPRLRKMIMQNMGAAEIGKAAVAEGMLTLRMDGWLKVIKGITTLEQVVRETAI